MVQVCKQVGTRAHAGRLSGAGAGAGPHLTRPLLRRASSGASGARLSLCALQAPATGILVCF